jgi:glycosyl transferase family 87
MKAWAWLLAGIFASAISWTYMHRVLLPWEHYVDVERGSVKEAMGDLFPRWVGTRELLLHGLNPYGAEVSHKIQIGFYGHPIEQSYDKPQFEIIDEQRFAYPVYVVFLLAPTIHVDFAKLQDWTPVVFGALTTISVWLWLAVLRWRPPSWMTFALALLVLSSPQVAQGLRLRQFGVLVAFLLTLATWCVTRNRLFAAGVLLAVATIKPQMVSLCLIWFLIWCLGDWKKRWPLAGGLALALGLLAGAGDILVPRWVRYFLEGIESYRKYFPTTSPVRLFLGNWMGGILSVLGVIVLLSYAWTRRKAAAESPEFVRVLSLFLVASLLVLPLLTPYNQLLLLLPVFMLVRDWGILPRWGRGAFSVLIAWPFVSSAALLAHPPQLDSLQRTPLLPSALLILTPFLVLWLMFTRSQRVA